MILLSLIGVPKIVVFKFECVESVVSFAIRSYSMYSITEISRDRIEVSTVQTISE